ncbi:hypothetical protein PR048_020756, partial [Dryococelus australis]
MLFIQLPQKLPTTLVKNKKHKLRLKVCVLYLPSWETGILTKFWTYIDKVSKGLKSAGKKLSGCKGYEDERKRVKRRLQVNYLLRHFMILDNVPGKPLKHISMTWTKKVSNCYTFVQIFLSIPSTTASTEHCFSVVRREKNYLRKSAIQERLSGMASFAINAALLDTTLFDYLNDKFAAVKLHKVD